MSDLWTFSSFERYEREDTIVALVVSDSECRNCGRSGTGCPGRGGRRDGGQRDGGREACSGASALAMGAGHAASAGGYRESDTVLLAGVCGPAPTDAAFTWSKARKLLHIR
jgi:hypothetical protein